MGRTITAFPWGGAAFIAPSISGFGKKIKCLFSFDKLTYQRVLQTISILQLLGIEVLFFRPDFIPVALISSAMGFIFIYLIFSNTSL